MSRTELLGSTSALAIAAARRHAQISPLPHDDLRALIDAEFLVSAGVRWSAGCNPPPPGLAQMVDIWRPRGFAVPERPFLGMPTRYVELKHDPSAFRLHDYQRQALELTAKAFGVPLVW